MGLRAEFAGTCCVFREPTTTSADGSYVFRDVPPGDHWITVQIPAGTEGCGGIFNTGNGTRVSTDTDCPLKEGEPRICKLPKSRVCVEFERPPPH